MPRGPLKEMFGAVTDPSAQICPRKRYSLPLSIAIHTAIVATAIIVPILAPAVLAVPKSAMVFRSVDIVLPTPPAPAMPRSPTTLRSSAASVDPNLAPVQPPSDIIPETGVVPMASTPGVEGGVPEGTGVTIGVGIGSAPPPEPQAPTTPLPVGGHIKAPTKTKDVRPVYPPIAQQARVQGIVIMEATISASGNVVDVRMLRSIPLLDQAALDAVRQWEFTPTLLNGVPVPVLMTVTVNFTLQ